MVIFIVPLYNEEENIPTLLAKTDSKMREIKVPYKIIFVNDGSTDNSLGVLESLKSNYPIEIYSYRPNRGVGEAFRIGFKRAIEAAGEEDVVVTKEADNTSDLNILPPLMSSINRGYHLALASCYAKDGAIVGTTFFRMFLSKAANLLLKLFLPAKNINTYSSFYRAYSPRALKELWGIYGERLIEEKGYECMVELLVKFARNGKFRICEIPMVLDGSRRAGKSKMRIMGTIKGFLKIIITQCIIYKIKKIFNEK